ncbi:uncharacterized protein [Miscanthus floridulus]|uniref:uncharacterized protein n=1 Tax=Miscanthus floridulus TaxID=154761 RepID=UPI00345A21AC
MTEVARGGRGVPGAPRGESGSTSAGGTPAVDGGKAGRGRRWRGARRGEAEAAGGDQGKDDGVGRGGAALQPTTGNDARAAAARGGEGVGSAARAAETTRRGRGRGRGGGAATARAGSARARGRRRKVERRRQIFPGSAPE